MRACDAPAPRYNLCKGPACFDWPEQVVKGCECPTPKDNRFMSPKAWKPVDFNTYPMTVPWGI